MFLLFQPLVDYRDNNCHLIHLEKSIHENKIETIFIQEPENIPAEKSYFPAFAVIKLNRLMHFTDKTLMNDGPIRTLFGILLQSVKLEGDIADGDFFKRNFLSKYFDYFIEKNLVKIYQP